MVVGNVVIVDGYVVGTVEEYEDAPRRYSLGGDNNE